MSPILHEIAFGDKIVSNKLFTGMCELLRAQAEVWKWQIRRGEARLDEIMMMSLFKICENGNGVFLQGLGALFPLSP